MWVLVLIRVARFWRQKIIGKQTPHWLKDSVGLIKYINLVGLFPTVYMMIFQPRHFFKRLPAILNGSKTYYLSPISFVTNVAALQIVLITLVFPGSSVADNPQLVLLHIGAVILSPMLLAAACVIVLLLWFICIHVWPINLVARELPFNYHGLLIPLNPETYAALQWNRYFWSLFYYYVYFYVVLLLVAASFVGFEADIWDSYASISSTIYINKFTIIPFALVGFFAAAAGHRLLIRPYVILIMESAGRQTRGMALFTLNDESSL
jgi:hypothetical protein